MYKLHCLIQEASRLNPKPWCCIALHYSSIISHLRCCWFCEYTFSSFFKLFFTRLIWLNSTWCTVSWHNDFFCSDLEELLHQLGVGQEGTTHSHNRKRRSITGSSLDCCNHEPRGLNRDWAQVRTRQSTYWLQKPWQNCCELHAGLISRQPYSSTHVSFPLFLIRYVFQPISSWIFFLWILICQFPRSTSDKFAQPSFNSC